jgi:hypothetical protein
MFHLFMAEYFGGWLSFLEVIQIPLSLTPAMVGIRQNTYTLSSFRFAAFISGSTCYSYLELFPVFISVHLR